MEIYRTVQPGQERLQKTQAESVEILRHLGLVAFEQPQLPHVRPDDFERLREFGRGAIDTAGESLEKFVRNGLPDKLFCQSQAPLAAKWDGHVQLDESILVIGLHALEDASLSGERIAIQQGLADAVPGAEEHCNGIFLSRLPQRHKLPLFLCTRGVPRAKLRAVQMRVGRVLADQGLAQLPIMLGPVEFKVEQE